MFEYMLMQRLDEKESSFIDHFALSNANLEASELPDDDITKEQEFEQFDQYSHQFVNGTIEEKIFAYSYFIEKNTMPFIEGVYDIAISDLESGNILLLAHVFVFLAKFFHAQEFEVLNILMHHPRNDEEYIISLLRVLNEHFHLIFDPIKEDRNENDGEKYPILSEKDQLNLLRLIVSRITKISMEYEKAVDLAADLLSSCFEVYQGKNETYQDRLIKEFIHCGDFDFFIHFYQEREKFPSISVIAKIVCVSNPSDVDTDAIINWIETVFQESTETSRREFSIILSMFSLISEANALSIIEKFGDFIISSITDGMLIDRVSAGLIYSSLVIYSNIEMVHSFLSSIFFGDFVIELSETANIDLLHIMLEGLQEILNSKNIIPFDENDFDSLNQEFFKISEDLQQIESQGYEYDFYIRKIMRMPAILTSELSIDILTLLEIEHDEENDESS